MRWCGASSHHHQPPDTIGDGDLRLAVPVEECKIPGLFCTDVQSAGLSLIGRIGATARSQNALDVAPGKIAADTEQGAVVFSG
jgi:hypothetical protein